MKIQGKTSYHRPHVKLLPDLVVIMHGQCVLKVLGYILYTTMSSEIAGTMP